MIVAVAADHAGRPLLDVAASAIEGAGHQVLTVGPSAADPNDDYPDIARAVGAAVVRGDADRGVVICGSGAGVSVAASKMHGVRAAVAHDTYTAHQMVEHDNVNVLAIGARVIGSEVARELVAAFVGAVFSNEERHRRRLAKVDDIESRGA